MTAPLAAFCDADVLVPIVCCDFLLTAAEAGLVDVVVSDTVLAEVERNFVENFAHLDPARLRRRVGDMRDFLTDQIVDVVDVDDLDDLDAIGEVVNAKDRHVVAAAITAEADVLVTNDRRLRDEVERSSLTIRPMRVDDFGGLLWAIDRDAVTEVLEALLAKRRRSTQTRSDFVDALSRHLPTLAQA